MAEQEEVKATIEPEKTLKKKVIEKQEIQKSRILEYLKNEHKWENYVLLVLALFALVLGCLILNGTLQVNEDFPVIGNFPKVFSWVLVVLSVFALLLSLYPFFKPCFPEFKKIRWQRPRQFFADVARVFIFLIILVLMFLLYDAFISKLIGIILNS